MNPLNDVVLDRFKNLPNPITTYLEPTKIDVKRLREDRSEIQIGDEVAFVATVAFRITHEGLGLIGDWTPTDKAGLKDLAAGDTLFGIAADGELLSVGLPIDGDSVSTWIVDNFDFGFLLNDTPHQAFCPVGRGKLAQPWIQKLNTAAVKDDYIDVDVRITERPPIDAKPRPAPRASFELGHATSELDGKTQITAQLTLQTSAAAKLIGRTVSIPIDGADDDVWLQITFVEQPARGGATQPDPTQTKHHK